MRLGLVVSRKSHLRQLAPIAERAVADGHATWLLCDHRGTMTRPPQSWTLRRNRYGKTWEFPDPQAMTGVAGGRASIASFTTDAALLSLVERERLDAVLCVNHLPLLNVTEGLRAFGVVVGQVQAGWDWVYNPFSGTRALLYDVNYGFAEPWRDWWVENVGLDGVSGAALERLAGAMKDRFVPVGYPGADLLAGLDRIEIRARLGLPLGRKIVLFLPFAFGKINAFRTLALDGAGDARQVWPGGIYGAGRVMGALNLLRWRAWQHWPYVVNGWNDRRVAEEARAFCVANDALLVVKSKHQTPPRDYLRAIADHVFHDAADGVDHPPLLLQLLAVADLCIHFGSGSFVECAAARVPALAVLPSRDEWPHFYDRRERFTDWLDVYDFPGVGYRLGVPEFVRTMARRRLEDFALAEDRWQGYMTRFFTAPGGDVSRRILDDLARRVAGARSLR